jgi:hypothetical protein
MVCPLRWLSKFAGRAAGLVAPGDCQQVLHFLVAGLVELAVPLAHRPEKRRCFEAYQLVDLWRQLGQRFRRRHRYRYDNLAGAVLARDLDRRLHGRAGGDAVVDQDHGPALHLHGWPRAPVQALAAGQFGLFAGGDRVDLLLGYPHQAGHTRLQDAHAAGADRTHREFLVVRHAELAYQQQIELGAQRGRHRRGNRHAAARQGQHDHVGPVRVRRKLLGQQFAGVRAVLEALTLKHVVRASLIKCLVRSVPRGRRLRTLRLRPFPVRRRPFA